MNEDTAYPIGNLPVSYSPPDGERFWRKVRRVAARIPFAEDLLAAYFCAVDRKTPTSGKELTVMDQLLGNVGRFSTPKQGVPGTVGRGPGGGF